MVRSFTLAALLLAASIVPTVSAAVWDAEITDLRKRSGNDQYGSLQRIEVVVKNIGTSDPYEGYSTFMVKAQVRVDGSIYKEFKGKIYDVYYQQTKSIAWDYETWRAGRYSYYAEVWDVPEGKRFDTDGPREMFTVQPPNDSPRITSRSPSQSSLSKETGTSQDFSASAKDPEGKLQEYLWEYQKPGTSWRFHSGASLNSLAEYSTSARVTFDSSGTWRVRVSFKDDRGDSAKAEWQITVATPARGPAISRADPGSASFEISHGESFRTEVRCTSDPDGDPVYVDYYRDGSIVKTIRDYSGTSYTYTFETSGKAYNLKARCRDSNGHYDTSWNDVSWEVYVKKSPQRGPAIDWTDPGSASFQIPHSQAFEVRAECTSDPDGDTVYVEFYRDGAVIETKQDLSSSTPRHSYRLDPGRYTLMARCRDANGHYDTGYNDVIWEVVVEQERQGGPAISSANPASGSFEIREDEAFDVKVSCGADPEEERVYVDFYAGPRIAETRRTDDGSAQGYSYALGPGTHELRARCRDENGNYDSAFNDVTWEVHVLEASPDPRIGLRATPSTGNAPLTVEFELSASGTGESGEWLIETGDGQTIGGQWPTQTKVSYTYASPGTFHARARIAFASGTHASDTITLVVTPSEAERVPPRIISFSPAQTSISRKPGTFTFQIEAIDDDEDLSYARWYLDDNLLGEFPMRGAMGSNILDHHFNTLGAFTVKVVVYDERGGTASLQWSVTIAESNDATMTSTPESPTSTAPVPTIPTTIITTIRTAPPEPPENTGVLRVKVMEGGTNRAVPGATVYLDNVRVGRTDDAGEFVALRVSPGPHRLHLRSPFHSDSALSVILEAGRVNHIGVHLQSLIVLGGSVVDATSGRPIAGAVVELNGFPVRATSEGAFQFQSVPPGKYEITATAPGYALKVQFVSIAPLAASTVRIELKRSEVPDTPPGQNPSEARFVFLFIKGALLGEIGFNDPDAGEIAYFAGWMAVALAPGAGELADLRDCGTVLARQEGAGNVALNCVAVVPVVGYVSVGGKIGKWVSKFGKADEVGYLLGKFFPDGLNAHLLKNLPSVSPGMAAGRLVRSGLSQEAATTLVRTEGVGNERAYRAGMMLGDLKASRTDISAVVKTIEESKNGKDLKKLKGPVAEIELASELKGAGLEIRALGQSWDVRVAGRTQKLQVDVDAIDSQGKRIFYEIKESKAFHLEPRETQQVLKLKAAQEVGLAAEVRFVVRSSDVDQALLDLGASEGFSVYKYPESVVMVYPKGA